MMIVNPKKRRASGVGAELGRVKAKRGKDHHFLPEQIDKITHLLASEWSKDEISEYYFLREDVQVDRLLTTRSFVFGELT